MNANREGIMPEHVVINAVPLIGELVTPAIMQVSRMLPDVQLIYRSELGMADLDDGNTIAIRAGAEPCGERNAVRWLGRIGISLVATMDYIRQMGMPQTAEDLSRHLLVANDFEDNNTPWFRWLRANSSSQKIIFRTNEETVMRQAIKTGRCAGFLPISSLIWSPDLIELLPSMEEWAAPLWLVHDRGASENCRMVGRELASIVTRQLS